VRVVYNSSFRISEAWHYFYKGHLAAVVFCAGMWCTYLHLKISGFFTALGQSPEIVTLLNLN